MTAPGLVTLGRADGAGARIRAQVDGQNCPDVLLQLPRTITGKVAGAFQASGWSWRMPDTEGGEIEAHFAIGLLGPRGGRHGTSVRLSRTLMQALAISLRVTANAIDSDSTHTRYTHRIGEVGQERIELWSGYRRNVLGGHLVTIGARGSNPDVLAPIHPEDLDHCAGLVRLVQELIAP